MKKETIRKIADNEELHDVDTFVEFFSRRFPNEYDDVYSYCAEWVRRFKDNPIKYMDAESKRVYKEVLFGQEE